MKFISFVLHLWFILYYLKVYVFHQVVKNEEKISRTLPDSTGETTSAKVADNNKSPAKNKLMSINSYDDSLNPFADDFEE